MKETPQRATDLSLVLVYLMTASTDGSLSPRAPFVYICDNICIQSTLLLFSTDNAALVTRMWTRRKALWISVESPLYSFPPILIFPKLEFESSWFPWNWGVCNLEVGERKRSSYWQQSVRMGKNCECQKMTWEANSAFSFILLPGNHSFFPIFVVS